MRDSRPLLSVCLAACLLVIAVACSSNERDGDTSNSPTGPTAGSAGRSTTGPQGGSAGTAVPADPNAGAGGGAASDAGGAAARDGATAEPNGPASDASTPDPSDRDAETAAADAGSDPVARFVSRPLAAPPSYLGSVDNSAGCSKRYPTLGFEPAAAGERFPLFLYFVGTAFVQPDPSASHDGQAALAVSEAMAQRGFVALSVGYDNGALAWASDHQGQLDCLFGGSADSLLAVACALPQVDCDQGIATWGHSLGAFVAVAAARFDPRVRAAWTTGYGGDATTTLSPNRLRVVNGEADTNNGTPETLNTITGLTSADCPTTSDECLRPDGSGWIIVRRTDLADPESSSADHCWFDKRSCLDSTIALEPTWIDPASKRAYALAPNADWLARTALRL